MAAWNDGFDVSETVAELTAGARHDAGAPSLKGDGSLRPIACSPAAGSWPGSWIAGGRRFASSLVRERRGSTSCEGSHGARVGKSLLAWW